MVKRVYLIFILMLALAQVTNAIEYGSVKSSDPYIDYSKVNVDGKIQEADGLFDKAVKEKDPDKKKGYLHEALMEYSLISNVEQDNVHAIVQMARIYDINKNNRYSKSYFFRALMIDNKNIDANYYFGDYFNTRKDYKNAIYYYNRAMASGAKETYDTCKKLGIIYEKLGDLHRANIYYKKAYLQNPKDNFLIDKITGLERVKYTNSKYYKKGN